VQVHSSCRYESGLHKPPATGTAAGSAIGACIGRRSVLLSSTVGSRALGVSTSESFVAMTFPMDESPMHLPMRLHRLVAQTMIDRRYPFAEIPAAISYLEQGHARGKVVVGAP
jgi:hypothetical protein